MRPVSLAALALASALWAPDVATAADGIPNDVEDGVVDGPSGRASAGRFLGPVEAIQIGVGLSSSTLRDTAGFDVARDVYTDGGEEDGDGGLFDLSSRYALTLHAPLVRYPILHARFTTALDRSQYVGLDLVSLDGSAGLSLEGRAGRVAASVGAFAGVGLTRTTTYFDETWQPLAQVGVHLQLELGSLFLEWVGYERAHLARTLDGRAAAPRIGTNALAIGWRQRIGEAR